MLLLRYIKKVKSEIVAVAVAHGARARVRARVCAEGACRIARAKAKAKALLLTAQRRAAQAQRQGGPSVPSACSAARRERVLAAARALSPTQGLALPAQRSGLSLLAAQHSNKEHILEQLSCR